MKSIKQILMERDGLTEQESVNLIEEATEQLNRYLDEGDIEMAEQVCEEYFGLEPDYLMELL